VKSHAPMGMPAARQIAAVAGGPPPKSRSAPEKWDGTGLSARMRQRAIQLFGRIVAVADVFRRSRPRALWRSWTMDEGASGAAR